MSNETNKVPMECPSIQHTKETDPISSVVENEVFPPVNADVKQIISKSQKDNN